MFPSGIRPKQYLILECGGQENYLLARAQLAQLQLVQGSSSDAEVKGLSHRPRLRPDHRAMPTHLASVCQQQLGTTHSSSRMPPHHDQQCWDPSHEDSHHNGSQQQQQQKQAQVPLPHERLHKYSFLCNLSAGPQCSYERTAALQTYPTFLCQPPHPLLKSFPVLFLRLLLS